MDVSKTCLPRREEYGQKSVWNEILLELCFVNIYRGTLSSTARRRSDRGWLMTEFTQ